MNAWSSDAVPPKYLHERTPLERQGALVFQDKQCRNCHEIGGQGGRRGPELDSVATRLTEDQLVRQVLQGGGNMPAYGNALSPAETTALVAFLKTLNGNDLMPARDASRTLIGETPPPEQTAPGQKKLPAQLHLSEKSHAQGKQ